MSKLLLLLASLVCTPAFAWDYATHTGNSASAGGGYTKCAYKTIFGYEFTIVVKGGMCPYTVQVDPPSGQVKI